MSTINGVYTPYIYTSPFISATASTPSGAGTNASTSSGSTTADSTAPASGNPNNVQDQIMAGYQPNPYVYNKPLVIAPDSTIKNAGPNTDQTTGTQPSTVSDPGQTSSTELLPSLLSFQSQTESNTIASFADSLSSASGSSAPNNTFDNSSFLLYDQLQTMTPQELSLVNIDFGDSGSSNSAVATNSYDSLLQQTYAQANQQAANPLGQMLDMLV